MRTRSSGIGAGCRALLGALAIAVLASCASSAPAQQPQRTYDRIRDDQIYPMTQGVLASAGYKAERCHSATVCLETAWKEYDGAKRERRMYLARFVRDAVDDRYMLYFGVRAQERPAAGADWTDRQIDLAKDAEYTRILQGIDRAVKQLGGVQY